MGKSRQKRSITIARHRTSISLEDAFWDALAIRLYLLKRMQARDA